MRYEEMGTAEGGSSLSKYLIPHTSYFLPDYAAAFTMMGRV
jgi:hypothetical protein